MRVNSSINVCITTNQCDVLTMQQRHEWRPKVLIWLLSYFIAKYTELHPSQVTSSRNQTARLLRQSSVSEAVCR